MTNEQILQKAIEKAEGNGWKEGLMYLESLKNINNLTISSQIKTIDGIATDMFKYFELKKLSLEIIFSHKFAKAFWGEDPTICKACERHHETRRDCDAGFTDGIK